MPIRTVVTQRVNDWKLHNMELYSYLLKTEKTCEFSSICLKSLEQYGSLSPQEHNKALRMKARAEATDREPAKEIISEPKRTIAVHSAENSQGEQSNA